MASRRRFGAAAAAAAVGVALVNRGYEDSNATWKQDFLWSKIVADTSGDGYMNPVETLLKVAQKAYLLAMTDIHEDIREGHKKATHGVGAHAKAHFEWSENPYSGMFQKADHCIIRMANAAQPGTLAMTAYGPNLAVKCLRDGKPSANMQFIWQIDGYAVIPEGKKDSCSFFEAPLCNHNPLRDNISMALKDLFVGAFNKVDSRSMLLGVSQMAETSQDGSEVPMGDAKVPFALVLEPAPGLNDVPCDFHNYTSQLLNLEAAGLASPGQVLYTVHAVHDPAASGPDQTTTRRIGSLVLDSPFTNSTFGDTELFFRHTFFEEELSFVAASDGSARSDAWAAYANDEDNYKREGANLYWPVLGTDAALSDPSMTV